MTHHPIAQIAPNGNPKAQEIRPCFCRFLRKRLLHSQRFARRLNASAILHGRLRNGLKMHFAGWSQPLESYMAALETVGLAITSLRARSRHG
jgi:hypothetical protein